MALLSQPETRGAPLFVGGLIIALLALTAAFLMWQRRYGESTLTTTTPFAYGQRFEGWIETELTRVPPAAVVAESQSLRVAESQSRRVSEEAPALPRVWRRGSPLRLCDSATLRL
jgi:hypothetical protein